MVKMFWYLLFLVSVALYAKPVYWCGRITYLYYLHIKENSIFADAVQGDYYREKLRNWLTQSWSLVKWQKDDL